MEPELSPFWQNRRKHSLLQPQNAKQRSETISVYFSFLTINDFIAAIDEPKVALYAVRWATEWKQIHMAFIPTKIRSGSFRTNEICELCVWLILSIRYSFFAYNNNSHCQKIYTQFGRMLKQLIIPK